MFQVVLFFFALFALFSLLRLPYDEIRDNRPVNFEDDRQRWFMLMEKQFEEKSVPPQHRTRYAIQEGLKSSPELREAMGNRQEQYLILSNQLGAFQPENEKLIFVNSSAAITNWPWDEFTSDISRVDDAKKELSTTRALSIRGVSIDVGNTLQTALSDVSENGIHLPDIKIPPIELPSPEEILRRIREALEKAKTQLEQIIHDESGQAEEVLRRIQKFVSIQIELLPGEIRKGIEEFNKFRHEHPYITAAATVVLVIIGMEVILPWAFLGILRVFGFSELGPVAGSWAAAIQSVVYGARTRGLFSILQRLTMSAKRLWPVAVFLDLAAVAAGTIAVWASGAIKDIVDTWYPQMIAVMPDLNHLVQGHAAAEDMFDRWMDELGRRCAEAEIPEVQWLDVAIQSIAKRVEEMTHTSPV
ncbi:hypothetical protein GYMLUDRAFT_618411 [Collybiopsis luxurians FD-317 M1]|uniref:Uncharacterized protein n=1 Tax=Collybiopsis luxurians FD-317 M1 TaxID=944289 RepID=A0A0D0BWS5_9AGAR|nr:hypothetical protein GYMLUDRAFT_618411 [Collybiopsis luxurians FD-317 M1]